MSFPITVHPSYSIKSGLSTILLNHYYTRCAQLTSCLLSDMAYGPIVAVDTDAVF